MRALLHSAVLHLVLLLALTADPILAESHLWVETNSCTDQRTAFAWRAAIDVNTIAQAAVNALSYPKDIDKYPNPAVSFFGTSPPPLVRLVLQAAVSYTAWIRGVFDSTSPNAQLRGYDFDQTGRYNPTIQIKCGDVTDVMCLTSESRGYVTSSQPGSYSTHDTIVLCDDFFLFDHIRPQSCSDTVTSVEKPLTGIGAPNSAQILLHHFVVAYTRGAVSRLADGAANSVMLESLRTTPAGPDSRPRRGSENADSYAWLATWAYAVGLGDLKPGLPRCLKLFRENVLAEMGVPPNVIEAEVQKRRQAKAQQKWPWSRAKRFFKSG